MERCPSRGQAKPSPVESNEIERLVGEAREWLASKLKAKDDREQNDVTGQNLIDKANKDQFSALVRAHGPARLFGTQLDAESLKRRLDSTPWDAATRNLAEAISGSRNGCRY